MATRGVSSKGSDRVRSDVAPIAPSVSFFELKKGFKAPSIWKNGNNFTIVRLQSPFGLSNPIMKASAAKALLVSVSLRSIPPGGFQLWADAKQLPTSYVQAFRSNIIDFDAGPGCWAGRAFDFIHYQVLRETLDDIADDFDFGRVSEYRQAVFEHDLVLAQMTRNILPSISRENKPSSLVLDQFQLVLGAHLLQRYGGVARTRPPAVRGLAKWQRQRAIELLRENLNGNVRLGELAKECGLSVSHFARSFKKAFGVSSHQWLIVQRIDLAKELLTQTTLPLSEVAAQSGFGDQPALTRTLHRIVGASPGHWRREHQVK